MKKNLLLTLSIMLFTATMTSAQSFEFQYQGKSVVDGGTVTIAAVPDDFGFGEYWCETNPSSDPNNGLILKLDSDRFRHHQYRAQHVESSDTEMVYGRRVYFIQHQNHTRQDLQCQ